MQHTGPVCLVPGAADMGTAVALLLSTGAFLFVSKVRTHSCMRAIYRLGERACPPWQTQNWILNIDATPRHGPAPAAVTAAPAGGLGLVTTGAIKPNNAQRKAISWITQSELHQPTMNTFLVARKSDNWSTATDMFPLQAVASSLLAAVSGYGYYGLPYAGHVGHIVGSAANRLIGEVEQSRRRPLLGPSPGWKRLLALSHLRHY